MTKETTLHDVLEAVNTMSSHMDERLDVLEKDMKIVKKDIVSMQSDIGSMKSDIGSMKSDIVSMKSDISSTKTDIVSLKSQGNSLTTEIAAIKSQMVTKEELHDAFEDFRDDMTVLIRKETRREDRKVNKLVEILKEQKTLSEADAMRVLSMNPVGA